MTSIEVRNLLQNAPGSELSGSVARGIDYVAMQVAPLDYGMYRYNGDERAMVGYAGLSISNRRLEPIAYAGGPLSLEQSTTVMNAWIQGTPLTLLRESSQYGSALLDQVVRAVNIDHPAALLLVERNDNGDQFMTLAASTLLGKISLHARMGANWLFKMKNDPPATPAERKADNMRKLIGADGREALIVAGALLKKRSNIPLTYAVKKSASRASATARSRA